MVEFGKSNNNSFNKIQEEETLSTTDFTQKINFNLSEEDLVLEDLASLNEIIKELGFVSSLELVGSGELPSSTIASAEENSMEQPEILDQEELTLLTYVKEDANVKKRMRSNSW